MNPTTVAHDFLTPVTRTTLTSDICRKMVTHLIRGDWQAGERIPPERELCVQLGVGRASLREALKALEIMGMIETRVGDGTYACARSTFLSRPLLWAIMSSCESEAQELVDARRLIEVELAGLAAERATTEDLAEIGRHLEELEKMAAHANQKRILQADLDRFLRADIGFHLAIADASHNSILRNALLLIRNLLQQWIADTAGDEDALVDTLVDHQQIFMAIAKRNELAARSEMKRHLQKIPSFLLQTSALAEVGSMLTEEQDEVASGN
jgi:GntR family transcriptional regulator, transcriptional repressor for pyruvate dehydrogenase complex